jgi:MoxR-like ATPase
MDEERLIVSKSKGNYERQNQVVSVEQILRAQEAVVKSISGRKK